MKQGVPLLRKQQGGFPVAPPLNPFGAKEAGKGKGEDNAHDLDAAAEAAAIYVPTGI